MTELKKENKWYIHKRNGNFCIVKDFLKGLMDYLDSRNKVVYLPDEVSAQAFADRLNTEVEPDTEYSEWVCDYSPEYARARADKIQYERSRMILDILSGKTAPSYSEYIANQRSRRPMKPKMVREENWNPDMLSCCSGPYNYPPRWIVYRLSRYKGTTTWYTRGGGFHCLAEADEFAYELNVATSMTTDKINKDIPITDECEELVIPDEDVCWDSKPSIWGASCQGSAISPVIRIRRLTGYVSNPYGLGFQESEYYTDEQGKDVLFQSRQEAERKAHDLNFPGNKQLPVQAQFARKWRKSLADFRKQIGLPLTGDQIEELLGMYPDPPRSDEEIATRIEATLARMDEMVVEYVQAKQVRKEGKQ